MTMRAWSKASGFDDIDLAKPIVGIAQTWSELNHCHIHFRELAEFLKQKAGANSLPYAMHLGFLGSNLLDQHKAPEANPVGASFGLLG